MKKLFVALSLFAILPLFGGGMLSEKWKKIVFHGTDSTQIKESAGKDSLTIKMLSDSSTRENKHKKRIVSYYQKLPKNLDLNGKVKLTFEARSSRDTYLLCCISRSPGSCPPGTRQTVMTTMIFKEYTLTMPLAGINPDSIFEFIWEGVMYAGDTMEIRNLKLEVDETDSSPMVYITSPVNLNCKIDQNEIRGRILPLMKQENESCTITLADDMEPEKIIAQTTVTLKRPETFFTIKADDLPESSYIVTANFKNAKPVVNKVWKYADESLNAFVKNGNYYRNGKKHTIIAIYHAGLWNIDRGNEISRKIGSPLLTYDEVYAGLAERGFNAVHSVMKEDASDLGKFAAIAKKHNLEVIPEIQIPEKVTELEVPDNVCAWYGADEAASVNAFERGRQRYSGCKSFELLPVVAANYTMEVSRVTKRNGAFIDGVLFDHYVIRTKNTDFTELSDELAKLGKDIAGIPDMVMGYVPQSFVYNGPEPTYEQVRLQVYLALIHGAKMFVYYSFNEDYDHRKDFTERKNQFPEIPDGMSKNPKRRNWLLTESVIWDRIGELNGEIKALDEFICGDVPSVKFQLSNKKIVCAIKKCSNGTILVAANPKPEAVSTKIRTSGKFNFVPMFGEGDAVTTSGRPVQLDFKPYEVKVLIAK